MKEKDLILLRDPDAARRDVTRRILSDYATVETVDSIEEARRVLARTAAHAIVARESPDAPDGVAFCRAVHQQWPDLKCVLVAAGGAQSPQIDAFNDHALFRCLLEPVAPEMLSRAVREAVRRYEMDRVQDHVAARAAEIDRAIHGVPYWLFRLRATLGCLAGMVGGSFALCLIAGVLLLLAGIGSFLILYYVKSALGIDIFPDRHLKDILSP